MSLVLEIKKMSKKYKRFHLNNISFSIQPGSICGFVGINGAGKSTTIRGIADLIKIDSGTVLFWGDDKHNKNIYERIGYVPDNSCFYGMQTILQVKKTISGLYSQWDETEYQKYMAIFRLDERKKIKELSKGMKVQFALALALSHHADLLIMDEPTSGLDPYIRNQILQILKEFVSNGKNSVLFSTHIISDLEKIADKIVFIQAGKIILEQPMSELPSYYQNQMGKKWVSLEDCFMNYIKLFRGEMEK